MAVSAYYEALVFEDGKKINVSRRMDMKVNGLLHWHPCVEILLSLSDQNTAAVNFKSHNMRINDIMIVYPGELHSVHAFHEDSWFILQFPADLLTGLSELNRIISSFPRRHYLRYDSAQIESEQMVMDIKKLVDLHYSEHYFKESRMMACLFNFFAGLGEYWEDEEEENGAEGEGAGKEHESLKLMAEACLYIRDNCAQPLTLEDVAHQAGISKSHFSHLFKRYTDMTFVDYLTHERIRKAETISLDPSKYITDIAFEAGFSSISSFNRAFRKVKGISPSEFRNKMVNRENITPELPAQQEQSPG